MKKSIKKSFTIGLDLGGTKLAAGLFNEKGELLDYVKVPVEMKRDPSPLHTQKRVIALMVDICLDFQRRFPNCFKKSLFRGVGLASAGPMNVETGTLIFPVNFPGWKKVPIQKLLSGELKKRKFPSQVFFQNDAVSAALAEGWVGTASKDQTWAVITVGTGIGTGVILNRRPVQSQGMGSEFGHSLIDLPHWKEGKARGHLSVEGIASGTGLLRRAQEQGFTGDSVEQLILEWDNDEKLKILLDDMALSLAILAYNLSIGFHPQRLLISGGLIKIKEHFLPLMKKKYSELVRDFNPYFECPIQIAKTSNKAGVIGAGYLPYIQSQLPP